MSTEENEQSYLEHGKFIRILPLYDTNMTASLLPKLSLTLLLISIFLASMCSYQFCLQLSSMPGGI